MATGAADIMFRCVFDGSLSMSDMTIERRPYHRNCKCAMHKLKGKCSHAGSQQRNVSFKKREFSNNCSFSLSASTISSQSSCVNNSSIKSRECTNEDSGRL
ncbi:hypothetical protein ACJIZ3_020602 [Penstemon smallii]|uniref:SWIM-type domain-containing protein n=1 Tax=Penstemon smallii TaxID=265156 RepID=A0ABD3SJB3_9LAMI